MDPGVIPRLLSPCIQSLPQTSGSCVQLCKRMRGQHAVINVWNMVTVGGLPRWLNLVPPTTTDGRAVRASLRESDKSLWTVPRGSKLFRTLRALSMEKKALATSAHGGPAPARGGRPMSSVTAGTAECGESLSPGPCHPALRQLLSGLLTGHPENCAGCAWLMSSPSPAARLSVQFPHGLLGGFSAAPTLPGGG